MVLIVEQDAGQQMSSHDSKPAGSERAVTNGEQIPGTSIQQQEIGSSERQSARLKYSKEHNELVRMQTGDKPLSTCFAKCHKAE